MIEVKNIKSIVFECKSCGAVLSVPFKTQQNFCDICPNCGELWHEKSGFILHLRALNDAFRYFSNGGAKVGFEILDESL